MSVSERHEIFLSVPRKSASAENVSIGKREANTVHHSTWHLLEGDLNLRDMGFVDTVSRHPSCKELPFWIFVIVKKGQRTLLLNGEKLRIGMNEFFLLPPHAQVDPLEYDDHAAFFSIFLCKAKQSKRRCGSMRPDCFFP